LPSALELARMWVSPVTAFDAKEFVFTNEWWLLLLLATVGWASCRRR
jgi:hypothetical protein